MNGYSRFISDFRAMTYLSVTSAVNTLKNMFRNPLTALSTIMKFLFYSWFLLMPLLVGLLRSGSDKSALTDITAFIPYMGGGIFLLLGLFILYTVKKAVDQYNPNFFKAADVNMVFTSPLNRRTVYLFAILRSIAPHLLSVLVLISVAYSITMSLHLKLVFYHTPLVIAGLLSFGLFIQTFRFMIYSLNKKYKIERFTSALIYIYLAAVILITLKIVLRHSASIQSTLPALNAASLEWIPFIGWAKGIVIGLVSPGGNLLTFTLLYFACAVATVALSVYWAVDYYEETADYVEKIGNVQVAIQKGKTDDLAALNENSQKKKTAVSDLAFGGGGEKVFFWKELLLYKQKLLSSPVGTLAAPFLLLAAGVTLSLTTGGIPLQDLQINLLIAALIISVILTVTSNPVGYELQHVYIFLLPGDARKKLFYTSLFSYLKSAAYYLLLLLPLFLSGRLGADTAGGLYLVSLSASVVNISGKILYTALFPDAASKNIVVNFFKGLFIYAYYLPGALILGLTALLTHLLRLPFGFFAGCAAFAVGSTGAVLIIYLISGAILRRMEYKD